MRYVLPWILAGLVAIAVIQPAAAGTISSHGPPAFTITLPDGWTDNPGKGQLANVMDSQNQRGFILGAEAHNVDLANPAVQQALSAGVAKSGGYPVTNTWIGTGPSPTFYLDTKFAIQSTVYNARYYYVEDGGYLYCLTILSVSPNPQDDSMLKSVIESFDTAAP